MRCFTLLWSSGFSIAAWTMLLFGGGAVKNIHQYFEHDLEIRCQCYIILRCLLNAYFVNKI